MICNKKKCIFQLLILRDLLSILLLFLFSSLFNSSTPILASLQVPWLRDWVICYFAGNTTSLKYLKFQNKNHGKCRGIKSVHSDRESLNTLLLTVLQIYISDPYIGRGFYYPLSLDVIFKCNFQYCYNTNFYKIVIIQNFQYCYNTIK